MDWELKPGEAIRRVELHRRYGGGDQGGISPSTKTSNVFIFSDPASGAAHGYIDDWRDDGLFHYTGEGQRGDQQMRAGNTILQHREDDRAPPTRSSTIPSSTRPTSARAGTGAPTPLLRRGRNAADVREGAFRHRSRTPRSWFLSARPRWPGGQQNVVDPAARRWVVVCFCRSGTPSRSRRRCTARLLGTYDPWRYGDDPTDSLQTASAFRPRCCCRHASGFGCIACTSGYGSCRAAGELLPVRERRHMHLHDGG
jgi:hypothetical protein